MKNTTFNVNTFMGLCLPRKCSKADIEKILINDLKWKNIEVYDYPTESSTNGLLIACLVIVGIWVGVLVISSVWTSFNEPIEIKPKKDE